ncbi:MAG: hypothetical protein JHC37_05430 [Campylobacteraceae bacterium]|nr:hypothetical protein [Campylobacteraceae bacterium]
MDFSLDTIKSSIDRITKISTSDRQKSLRWLSRQNDLIVYDVFKLQKSYFHRLKSQNDDDLILLSIASLFLALRETISASNPVKRKNRSADFNFLRQISKNRAKQFRKARKKVKYEKLLDLQSVIYSLATIEKFSTREISKYLLKHHRLEISHASISKFLKQIKESNHD